MKVLIVDDHPMVRKGISSTLVFEKDVEEIQEAATVAEAMQKLSEHKPDISIIDLMLGREDGLEIISSAKKKDLKTKFIVLTSSPRKNDFLRAQEIGVDGYILKEAFTEDIIYALHVVARGKKFFDPEIICQEINSTNNTNQEELSPRERDVLSELGKGLSNLQIAKRLYISENTVKKHVSNILMKLELKHRTEAALFVNNSTNL